MWRQRTGGCGKVQSGGKSSRVRCNARMSAKQIKGSFGYRPGRKAHQALDAIRDQLPQGRTEVVDADLSGYFDTIDHAGLLRLVAGRVSDGSILRLVKRFLKAPIVEREAVREERNHWTKHRSCAEAVRRVNRITRSLSNTDHYGHGTCVFGRQQVWLQNRVRRWLSRQDDCTPGLFSFFTDERLLGHDQRWPFPRTCAWRRSLCDVGSRKAGCGKSARLV